MEHNPETRELTNSEFQRRMLEMAERIEALQADVAQIRGEKLRARLSMEDLALREGVRVQAIRNRMTRGEDMPPTFMEGNRRWCYEDDYVAWKNGRNDA